MTHHNTEKVFIKIGNKIASVRKEQKLTQTQLAILVDISQSVLASYEIGRRRIPIPILIEISKALNIYIEDLLPIGEQIKKRGPLPQIDKELSKVKNLSESQQKIIIDLIHSIINNTKLKKHNIKKSKS